MNNFIVVRAAHDDEPCIIPIDNISYIERVTDTASGHAATHIYLRQLAGARQGLFVRVATPEMPTDILERINAALKLV